MCECNDYSLNIVAPRLAMWVRNEQQWWQKGITHRVACFQGSVCVCVYAFVFFVIFCLLSSSAYVCTCVSTVFSLAGFQTLVLFKYCSSLSLSTRLWFLRFICGHMWWTVYVYFTFRASFSVIDDMMSHSLYLANKAKYSTYIHCTYTYV